MFKKTLLVISLFAATGSAFAADGTLNFTGSFTDSPCQVNINGSNASGAGSVSVPLATWSKDNFKSAGLTTDLKPIVISLSACPEMTEATIQFVGNVNQSNPNLFAVNPGVASAENVGIALYKDSNTANVITPNSRDLTIPLTSQAGEYTLYASYMTTGAAGNGEANADVTLDISYQ